MVLPIPDLTGVIAAIDRNTSMMQNIVDELVRMNEDTRTELETQVRDIREVLENQYKARIELLESQVPQNANPIPHGWSKLPPGFASPE